MYLKNLLRYRNVWLGIALIWIILYHCPLDFGLFHYFKDLGYGGVDICIFASGIGCFYSLSADTNIFNFIKRRIKRLVPTYIIFIAVWLLLQYIEGNFGLQMAVGNILALQYLAGNGHAFNWYISAIFLLYILAPYFQIIAEKAILLHKIMFLVFLLICSIPFWHANTYIIIVTRLPIFYVGMIFADMCKKDRRLSGKHIIGIVTAFLLGVAFLGICFTVIPSYLWPYGLFWYPFILITPPLCIAISYFSILLERTQATKSILSFLTLCGDYSFELYLVHVLLLRCITRIINVFDLSRFSYFIWIAGCIPLFLGCFMLRHTAALFSRFLVTLRNRRIK